MTAVPADLVVANATQILTMEPSLSQIGDLDSVPDRDLLVLGVVTDGAVAIQGKRVVWVGDTVDLDDHVQSSRATVRIDAQGGIVLPGLIDPHTHLVFAGSRHDEWGMRIRGGSYLDILARGGGILSTVAQTREASAQALAELALPRLKRFLAAGVTTCEVKSGYGLDVAHEIKILEVVRALSTMQPVRLVPTLLGAHALPHEFRAKRDVYVRTIVEEMIPEVAERKLAEACDVFVEEGAFRVDEARAILGAAKAAGLRVKLHAGQFKDLGGPELAAELGALSADHLVRVSDEGLERMAEAGVTAVLLPGASFSMREPMPDGHRIRAAGVDVALGTDCNPGTSNTENLPLMIAFGVCQVGLTVEEAVGAVTRSAARAIGREADFGSLRPGSVADLAVYDVPDYRCLAYRFGTNHTAAVVKDGELVWQRAES